MTKQEAANLARKVKEEASSKVSVRLGQTNGRRCVHVNDVDPKDPSRSSFTIYSFGEWQAHPLNRASRGLDGSLGAEVKVTHV